MKEEKSAFERIYDIIREIPEGKVASYGQVAELAGNRRWARVVGYALHAVPEDSELPCHRVVTKDGNVSCAFSGGICNRQMELLKKKGVGFIDDHSGYATLSMVEAPILMLGLARRGQTDPSF
ncbi:MAG: MGMT family protein [[Clostridium] scindens]